MKSRKQRRFEAAQSKNAFTPNYNGNAPVTYQEYYGEGFERFNSKTVTIREVEASEEVKA